MEKSVIQFKGFIINKSLFSLNKNDVSGDLNIEFSPSGELDRVNSKFNLNLGVIISEKTESLRVEIAATGAFVFSNLDDEGLNNFLFLNAPAILFPYIRAYISTLTTLSGINPIVLPTLNLSALRSSLENKIKEVDLK